jgi:hypothetical protein
LASAVGTVIRGTTSSVAELTPFLRRSSFHQGDATEIAVSAFAVYGAGFAVRPFGAVVFGRIGT